MARMGEWLVPALECRGKEDFDFEMGVNCKVQTWVVLPLPIFSQVCERGYDDELYLEPRGEWEKFADRSWLEADIFAVVVGGRVGFNILQALDFIIGWTTVDILEDDRPTNVIARYGAGLIRQIGAAYPFLLQKKDFSIKNLSLDAALAKLESVYGGKISYRKVGLRFRDIQSLSFEREDGVTVMLSLAAHSGSEVYVEEDDTLVFRLRFSDWLKQRPPPP